MMDNKLITQFIAQINNAIDYKISGLTNIKSAIVHSVNQDETVNLFIPPNNTIYHNIQNQSIYRNLKPGDNIKIIVENGNLSNMWIIGGFKLDNNQQQNRTDYITFDVIYPIGSVYISAIFTDPAILFGGRWEYLHDSKLSNASADESTTVYLWKRIG